MQINVTGVNCRPFTGVSAHLVIGALKSRPVLKEQSDWAVQQAVAVRDICGRVRPICAELIPSIDSTLFEHPAHFVCAGQPSLHNHGEQPSEASILTI